MARRRRSPALPRSVPVLATAAVIVASPWAVHGPVRLLQVQPLVWVGQRSYSIYLWHWPALVLVAAWLGPLSAGQRAITVLGSVGVAAVTFKVLEDPLHHSRWLAAKARRGLVMGGGLIAAAVTTSIVVVITAPPLVGAGSAAAPVVLSVPTVPAPERSSPALAPRPSSPSAMTPASPSPAVARATDERAGDRAHRAADDGPTGA